MTAFSRTLPELRDMLMRAVMLVPLVGIAANAQPTVFRDNPGARLRYFHEQRAYPYPEIPKRAFATARKQLMALQVNRGIAYAQAVGSGWTAIGPNNVNIFTASSGRLTTIAVHPTMPATIFVGGAQGGVWKSVNGGANWSPMTDDQCSLAMGSVVIDQQTPNIIYAGTGEMHNSADSYYGCGVLRSTDGGATWQQMGASVFDVPNPWSGGGMSISKIVVDRGTAGNAHTTIVFATTNNGIYKSVNSGLDWVRLTNGLPPVTNGGGTFADMVADTLTPGTFYAATGRLSSAPGIYKTVNHGSSWTKLTIPPTTNIGRMQIAISQSSPNVLYASAENITTLELLGIYRSNDRGVSWTQLSATGANCSKQCWYDQHIHVDPTNPAIVYFGGVSLFKSTNAGASFSVIGGQGQIHVDHHAFAFDPVNPAIIYSGNDGGIYKSTDGGATWTSLNTDLSIHQFYAGFSMHPTQPNRMMGGSQDNGTNEYHGSPSWLNVYYGDGGYTAIDHQNGNTSWAETQWEANSGYSGPARRDGASANGFVLKTNGINLGDRAAFIPPLIMDPVNPKVLYFGTFRLYRTRDNGESWTAISPDLTGASDRDITSIAVARTDTNQIYVGTNDGKLHASSNGGGSFTLGSGYPNRTVTDIAAHPTDANIAYATFSGFNAPHVYKTTNRGLTWTSVSGNLPDVPANAIVIQPGVEIDVGTDLGVFRSTDDGATWSLFPGLPNVAVFDLVFNPTTRLLVAATHGRGAFTYTVSAVMALRGDVTQDYVVSALDAQAVLSATVGLPLAPGWSADGNRSDANCDGNAPTAVDAQVILSFVVGLPVPAGACVGKYQ